MGRVLVPIRTSRDTEESTSPESQKAGADDYRDTHPGTQLIFTDVEDLGVSGATAIASRPGIAPWLSPDKIIQWDAIGVYEVDRLSRNMEDYLGFVRSMDKIGKVIIDLIDGTDTSTPEGRRNLEDRVLSAQRYREAVAEKRARAAQRIANAGRWGGGRIPFGYRAEKREWAENGKTKHAYFLVKDEVRAKIARRMVDWAIDGMSRTAIADKLNSEGIKSRDGGTWHATAVAHILTSPALMGYMTIKKHHVITMRLDRDGQPVKFTDDAIVTADEFRTLQDVLAGSSYGRNHPQARRLLWNVAFCRDCSLPCDHELPPCEEHDVKLYGYKRVQSEAKGDYYECKQCRLCCNLDRFDAYIDYLVRTTVGDNPLREAYTDWGDESYSSRLRFLENRVERLRRELRTEYDANIEQAIQSGENEIKQLISGPQKKPEPMLREVQPRTTIAEHWASLDAKGRNKLLREWGAVFHANRDGVEGNLGWAALDAPAAVQISVRKSMHLLRMPPIPVAWDKVDEKLEVSFRRTRKQGPVQHAIATYLSNGHDGTPTEIARALYGEPTEIQIGSVRRAMRTLRARSNPR
jgi:site-specific DNA recombinase